MSEHAILELVNSVSYSCEYDKFIVGIFAIYILYYLYHIVVINTEHPIILLDKRNQWHQKINTMTGSNVTKTTENNLFPMVKWKHHQRDKKSIPYPLLELKINSVSLKRVDKLKFLGVPRNFPCWVGDLPSWKNKLNFLSVFLRKNLSWQNKSCVIEKIPATAFIFVYSFLQ